MNTWAARETSAHKIQFRSSAICDDLEHLSWFSYENDSFVNLILIPSFELKFVRFLLPSSGYLTKK